jgi:hypothetical protein
VYQGASTTKRGSSSSDQPAAGHRRRLHGHAILNPTLNNRPNYESYLHSCAMCPHQDGGPSQIELLLCRQDLPGRCTRKGRMRRPCSPAWLLLTAADSASINGLRAVEMVNRSAERPFSRSLCMQIIGMHRTALVSSLDLDIAHPGQPNPAHSRHIIYEISLLVWCCIHAICHSNACCVACMAITGLIGLLCDCNRQVHVKSMLRAARWCTGACLYDNCRRYLHVNLFATIHTV